MPKSAKIGNALLCEYVAKGDGGKNTLVNVFAGNILVSEFPARLMFGLYFEIIPGDKEIKKGDLQILRDGKMVATATMEFAPSAQDVPMATVLQSFPVPFEQPGSIDIKFSIDGGRPIQVLRKMVGLIDEATAPRGD